VLGIIEEPVASKILKKYNRTRICSRGMDKTTNPLQRTGVAVIGSDLQDKQRSTTKQSKHTVTVFERDNAIGGLLRYGIPKP
jgi:glutamate synthase (NADPH/NADH) small chain